MTKEWGDWTWAYKTQAWLGTYVVKVEGRRARAGRSRSPSRAPAEHGGLPARLPGRCRTAPSSWGSTAASTAMKRKARASRRARLLMRSDDRRRQLGILLALAYDAARSSTMRSRAILRLKDGRLVCFLRTHVNPSGDAKNMVMVVSEDDGFSWTPPKWLNIWGYPAECDRPSRDGRYLMVYGYRRPPIWHRGCISEDGISWDIRTSSSSARAACPLGLSTTIGKPRDSSRHERPFEPANGRLEGSGITGTTPASYQHMQS